jgi:large subunit ribosomal protein L20
MARTARSTHSRKKRRKVLGQARGYRGQKSRSYKKAKEQVWKSGVYAYEGRKQRKRDFRSLWIQRINAASREHGLSYSQFVHGLRLAEIDLDRKVLADLAATEPEAFAAIAAQAKNALQGEPVRRRIEVERRVLAEPAPEPERRGDAEVEATDAPERRPGEVEEAADEEGKVHATEAAERKAGELGVDLSRVEGTGQGGRITVGDVQKAAKARADNG